MLEGAGEYAHDILLDTYDQCGIFAFLALIVLFVINIYQTARFVFDRRFSFNVRLLVLCVSIVFAVEFFIEPILQGITWFFCAFCFMQGVIANALENADKIERYQRYHFTEAEEE